MSDKKSILIVEDDSILALAASRIIKKNGFEAKIVHTGEKAVNTVSSDRNIDLVLMDIDLGAGIDGTEAARQILKIKELPIIFLTSHSEKEYVDKVKSITRYGYVVKDSGEFVLMESINMAFELFEVNRKLKEDISKRIKTENELKKSESRLSTIFFSSPAGICINTADKGVFLDVNDAFTKITGYRRDEVLGNTPDELGIWVNDESGENVEKCLKSKGHLSNDEFPFVKKNKDTGYAMISSEYIEYNGLSCILTLINDITESKKALSALSESRKMLFNSQKAARLETWTVDLNTKEQIVNSRGDIRWFDTNSGFNINMVLDAADPEDRDLIKKAWDGVLEGKPFEIEHRALINNRKVWLFVKAEAEFDKQKRPCKVIGVTLDVTERKKAEEDNLNSISLLKAALESTADGLLVIGLDGKIKSYNQRFADMWKLPPEAFNSEFDSDLLEAAIQQLKNPEEFLNKVNFLYNWPEEQSFDKVQFKDGRVFERYSIPQRINEKVVGRVWSFRDISEKFEYERAIHRSEQRLRAMINAVPDLMFTLDKNGNFIEHHTRNSSELYLPPDQFLGKNIKDVLPPEISLPASEMIQKAIKYNSVQTIEYKMKINDKEGYYEDRIVKSSENEVLSIIREVTRSRSDRLELEKREKIFTIISQFAETIFKNGINPESINFILSGLGNAFNLSRSYIFKKIDENEKEIIVEQIYEWCSEGIFSSSDVIDVGAFCIPKGTSYEEKVKNMLLEGYLKAKLSDLNDEYETYLMQVQELKSYIFIPIFVNEQWWGLIGFDECKFEREWSMHEIEALKTAANILGGSLERDMAEKELADSMQLYFTLIDASPDSYSVTDISGNQIFASKKALELFGYPKLEDVVGKSVFNWVTEAYAEKAVERFTELVHSGKTETETYVLKKKDGTEFTAELTACRYSDAAGQPKGIIIITRDISMKMAAERKLAEEAARRKILIDESRDGIVLLDHNGKISEVNKKFCDMLGYDEAEAKNLHVWDWDINLKREDIEKMIENIDENGDHFETKHKRKDGSSYDVEISSNGTIVNGNKLIFCVCRDITARKAAERKIRESEEKFSKIFKSSPVGISITRLSDGVYIDANDALLNIGGYSREEVIGHSTIELKVYDDETRKKHIGEFLKTGRLTNAEHNFLRKDGSAANVIFSWELIELNGEKCVLGIVIDITERKAVEKKIRESEERFSRIFHSNPVGIAITKVETGEYVDVNDSMLKMLGYSREDLIGKSSVEIGVFDPVQRNGIIEEIKKNGKVNNAEIEYNRRDGSVINLLYSFELVDLNNSKFLLGIVLDISEKKKFEMELIKSLDEKNILLKELQHRVKNNLSVISSLLHLELDSLRDEHSRNVFRNSISRINSLAAIYEQLYSSEMISEINLYNYLNRLVDSLSKTYNINEKVKIDSDMKKDAFIDLKRSVLIGLIFNELISNSLKYAYPEGRSGNIIAGFDASGGTAKLYVKDNGIGMPKDFDLKKSKSLGLKLVQMLTEQLEGDLKIKSGKGTSVEIRFKL